MKLFVGLGNPGKEYEKTRHNMGWIAIEKFADSLGVSFSKSDFKGEYEIIRNPVFPEPIIICKPQTYMNSSGECVQPLAAYYHIDPSDIVIVYDEMAIPEGSIRLRPGGSDGGHNGMKSIIQRMGTQGIKRIRIGIGEPTFNSVDYVLGKPSGEDAEKLDQATDLVAKALKEIAIHGFDKAMNLYNKKEKEVK